MSTRADYFIQAGRVVALAAACEGWRGTPFRACSSVKGKGGGIDCAGFVAAVFLEIGAIDQSIAIEPYAINHAEHSDESRLRAWFERDEVRARVRRVDESEAPLAGDLVFPIVGRCEHHLGLQVGGLIWHVARPSGVCTMTTAQLKLARSRYRLTETTA